MIEMGTEPSHQVQLPGAKRNAKHQTTRGGSQTANSTASPRCGTYRVTGLRA